MRKIFIASWMLILMILTGSAMAQAPVENLAFLSVEMWPDYDQPSVLVLLTGTLSPDATLPAEVTVSLPANADLNAVARIDNQNRMIDDVVYTRDGDVLTFTTPDSLFRIEYYVPYTADGDRRQFQFEWQTAMPVGQISTTIQEPLAATDLTIEPGAVNVSADRSDGMNYHTLPAVPVAANAPYRVNAAYEMANPTLSVALLGERDGGNTGVAEISAEATNTNTNTSTSTSTAPSSGGINWPLILGITGGALVLSAVVWQVATSRSKPSKATRPKPQRNEKPAPKQAASGAKFCQNCGQPRQPKDDFCRSCGVKLKG